MFFHSPRGKTKGFTLIEILVALAVVALIVTVALPMVTRIFSENIKSSARKLAGTVRYIYNQSVIQNQTIRLVYDLESNKYWAEVASQEFMMIDKDAENSFYNEEEEEDENSQFAKIPSKLIPERSLDGNVRFQSIYTEMAGELVTEGRAYTHFFPGGMIEATVIHLVLDDKVFSLVIEPMLGMAKIYDNYVEPDFD